MSENKCCGNCKHFQNESATGKGWCNENDWISNVDKVCKCHEDIDNGWTEITPDNVEELYDKPIAVAWKYEDKTYYSLAGDCTISLATMAKYGGYYYHVLPELKLED
jgi:hypothetical protein